jgi:hypothetical protein
MPVLSNFKRLWCPAAVLPLLFFGQGLAFLPLVGIQADEVYFVPAMYGRPTGISYHADFLGRQIPLMLLSYLGALKCWIYAPILSRIRPSYWTIRLPVLLMGAVSIWLFVWLLEKVHNRQAAWVGGLLLATDTMYLLTSCFDWGPVALQHLLSLAGIALLWKFWSSGDRWALFWGFFWFGVAFWDKALFIWLFSGLLIATLVIFPRELWSRCTPRNLGLAAAGLLVGALPLVVYNLTSNFNTLRSNSTFAPAQIPSRFEALRLTWDGQILWDYMAHAPWAGGYFRDADTDLFDVSDQVQYVAGVRYHYYNALVPAFCLALILLPFLWRTRARKPMLFCLIATAVAWIQMAVTKGAGEGAHHTVLLWPLPHWFLAVAFVEAAAWRRLQWKHAGAILLAALLSFLAVDNLLLTNEYYYQFAAYGAVGNWDDAIFALSEKAGHIQAPRLAVADWGIINQLMVLHRNRLPLYLADSSFLAPGGGKYDREFFMRHLTEDVWIGHTRSFQAQPGLSQKILQLAGDAGFQKRVIEVVWDRNGRPVFEIYRFVPAGAVLAAK